MNRNLKTLKLFVGAAAGLAIAAPAMAIDKLDVSSHTARGGSYTFPSFNAFVTDALNTQPLDTTPLIGNTYGSWELTVDWSDSFDSFSSEAQAGLWDIGNASYLNADFTATNAQPNGDPIALSWSGSFVNEFTGTGAADLELDMLQTWGGSSANWNNVTLTMFEGSVSLPMLSDISIGNVGGGSNVMGNNGASADVLNGPNGFGAGSWSGGDDVYTLNWGGGDLTVDLFFTNANGDLDLFVWGDDTATNLLGSGLSVTDNEQVVVPGLAAGTYYIHIDGWQGASNDYKLNVVPTPGALAVFGLAGLAAARRRR